MESRPVDIRKEERTVTSVRKSDELGSHRCDRPSLNVL